MANKFIGQVNIGSDTHLIGSTLFATSSSLANAETKEASLQSSAAYSATTGVTVHVQFANSNSVTDSTKLKLKLGTDTARFISNPNGSLSWSAGSIISFTFDGTNWVMNSSAIDGSSIQNLSLGNITNEGKLGTASSLVVTNANQEITTGVAFGSTANGTFLDNTGAWSTPPDTKYKLVIAASNSATSDSAGTNGSTYLNLVEDSTVLNSHKLTGTNITITSTAAGEIKFEGKAGTVTSVKIQTTSPVTGGSATATTTSGEYTIALADGYGDTKNPYGTKTANYILAGPASGNAAAPTFRQLVDADIPNTIARLASPAFTGTPTAPTVADATDSSTNIATTAFVAAAINSKLASNDAMLFKGTIGTGGTVTSLPATHNAGDTYRVITANEYAGQQCEIGDLIICIADGTTANDAHWTVAQTNIDGALFQGTTYTSGQLLVAGNSGAVSTSGYTLEAPAAAGDILYASSTTAYSRLAKGSSGQVLTINSSGLPSWADNASTTNLYVTSSTGTANTTSALTNGNVYLRLFDVTTARDTHRISGAGGTTVTTDTSANIIITSKTYSASTTTVLNSLTLKYNNGSAHTETPSTDTYVAEVNGGILYIKSIVYGTDNTVNTGFAEVTT